MRSEGAATEVPVDEFTETRRHLDVGGEGVERLHDLGVERHHDRRVHPVQRHEFLCEYRCRVERAGRRRALDLDVEGQVGERRSHLGKRRDAEVLGRIAVRRCHGTGGDSPPRVVRLGRLVGAAGTEPPRCVESLKFGEGEACDVAGGVRRPVDGEVMDDHHDAVGRELHVHLEHVGSRRNRLGKPVERRVGVDPVASGVGDVEDVTRREQFVDRGRRGFDDIARIDRGRGLPAR